MYIVNYLSDVRMARALYTLHVEVDVRSRRLWIILFATGLSMETLGFTSSDFRWDFYPNVAGKTATTYKSIKTGVWRYHQTYKKCL